MSDPLVIVDLHEWLTLKEQMQALSKSNQALRMALDEAATGRSHYAGECDRLVAELAKANERLRGYEAWERSVNEALNSGDGAYRP